MRIQRISREKLDIDVVLESTGLFTSRIRRAALKAGANAVISAPAKDRT